MLVLTAILLQAEADEILFISVEIPQSLIVSRAENLKVQRHIYQEYPSYGSTVETTIGLQCLLCRLALCQCSGGQYLAEVLG